MASERRFLLAFAVSDKSGDISFLNVSTTVEGNLEPGIEAVKKRVIEDFRGEGVSISPPVLLSALELEQVRPPSYVELPIMVRRSLEQLVSDFDRYLPMHPQSMRDIANWLKAIKEESH